MIRSDVRSRGCHYVEPYAGGGGAATCTLNNEVGPCPAVLYRYPDGRDQTAYCPTGTQMVITAAGIPGTQTYTFSPASGAGLIGELPDGCSLVGGEYQCDHSH